MLPPTRRERLALAVQREVSRLTTPVWASLAWVGLRVVMGYRIAERAEARVRYRALLRESDAPLLLCANHLTLIDSALIAWALGSPAFYMRRFSALPWNLPDRANFASTLPRRALAYVTKCIPMPRRGRRTEVGRALGRFAHVLRRGDVCLVFPEGGRSRSGRVEVESAAVGVGRLIGAVPGCRVLCVYLRGERQRTWGSLPARGDRFRVLLAPVEPKSEARGLRRSLEVARQVTAQLAALEQRYFDDRQ